MNKIIVDLEEALFMELDRKQTEQIYGGLGGVCDSVSESVSESIETASQAIDFLAQTGEASHPTQRAV